MGRTLYSDRGDPTGHLLTEGRQWQHSHQHLEHRTVTSFLPLKIWSYRFLSFNVYSYKAPRPKHFRPGSLRGSPGVRYHLSFLLSYGKYLFTRTKGLSIPLITLRNFALNILADHTPPRPTVTSSWASWVMPRSLRLQPMVQTGRCEKERIKKQSYARVKIRNGWDMLPLTVWFHHKNETYCIH